MTNQHRSPSRLSYTHERSDIFGDNPLQYKAPRLSISFAMERCPLHAKQFADPHLSEAQRRRDLEAFKQMRRGSQMVQLDRPRMVHKPSPALAHGPDREVFNQQWKQEDGSARRANRLDRARVLKTELQDHIVYLDGEDQNRQALFTQAESGDVKGATKEAFKLMRRTQQKTQRVLSKSRAFRQEPDDF